MTGHPTALKRARAIRKVLLDYGVPEVSIELCPGRPTSGDQWNALDPVAVMSHHIASRPTPSNPTPGLALVKRGRPDLPGPLCNGTAGVDLVYRIITLGLANHSGYGGSLTVHGPLGSYRIPQDNGRPFIWGTEYEGGYDDAVWDRVYTNRRTGQSMSFREFMGRCNAALVEAIWLDGVSSRGKTPTAGMDLSGYHLEHKTWAPGRKPDRHNYTTESGRAELRRYTKKDDDMPLTDNDIDRLAHAVWAKEIGGGDNRQAARLHLIWSSNAAREAAHRLRNGLGTIREAVDANASHSEIRAMLDDLDAEVAGATVQLNLRDEEQ